MDRDSLLPGRENAFRRSDPVCYKRFMLGEFKVGRCSRQCYAENRPLKEGEWYYSVVISTEDEYERRDYSADSWTGSPEGTVGYWKCRMPAAGEKKLVLAPKPVLIDLLRQMESMPDKAKTRYLLALTLLRRRMVRLADSAAAATQERVGDGEPEPAVKFLSLILDDGSTIEIADCEIARSESESLSESLSELLYCEASEIEQD